MLLPMSGSHHPPFLTVVTATALCLGVALSACGGSGKSTSVPRKVVEPRFDPGNFGDAQARPNRYLPLVAGYQTVREGGVNKGHRRLSHRRVYTVTDVTKEIDGVRAVAVLDTDFDGGEVAEQAIDWLVPDNQGNVWNLGAYTEAYEGGQYVNSSDAWLAGVQGARGGILIKANPTRKTPAWSQGKIPGHEPSPAFVAATDRSSCVPFKCFKHLVIIQEGPSEWKYYAAGVGSIRTEPRESGGAQETERLINIRQLSPVGLAEISNEVLQLDRHAQVVAKRVYGNAPAATRAG